MRYRTTSATAIGWVRVITHRGVTMAGRWSTGCRVISQGDAAVADDDAGAQRRHRDPGLRQGRLDLAPAAQVGGQLLAVVTETAEVDDPLQPGSLRRAAPKVVAPAASLFSKSSSSRVHEVVGRIAAGHRRVQ